ncbi:hypothetical protein C8Q73DRAFT_779673 [Cubamyces lactineus]|nr:hypothetical protein C8Q73DRAFT_779673 [Cubamyces lactineus]
MRRSSESPGGSARKRRRLSSPTYEEHFGPISQNDVQAFDEVEFQLSQSGPVVPSQSRGLPSEEVTRGGKAAGVVEQNMGDEDDAFWGNDAEDGKEWSSSPVGNLAGTQERAADENFFTTGSNAGGGFVSAAKMSPGARPPPSAARPAGLASAAALSTDPQPSQSFGGFSSTANLPSASQTPEAAAPFVPPRFTGFGRASALPIQPRELSPPPSPPPERPDYDSWFDTDISVLPPDAFAFKTARTVLTKPGGDEALPTASQPGPSQIAGFTSGLAQWKSASQVEQSETLSQEQDHSVSASKTVGFASAAQLGFAPVAEVGFSSAAALNGGKSNWAAPSAEALARAAARMKQWEAEFEHEDTPPASEAQNAENTAPSGSDIPPVPPPPSFQTPLRPALRPVENGSAFSSAQPPDTPSPAGAALKSTAPTHFTVVAGMQIKNKPFKSPLISRPQQPRTVSAPSPYVNSPLNPGRRTDFRVASSSKLPSAFAIGASAAAGPSTPAKMPAGTSAFVSPLKLGGAAFTSPVKSLGMTPRRMGMLGTGKGKFSTPFKPGMAPGEPGRSQLEQRLRQEQTEAAAGRPVQIQAGATSTKKGKEKKTYGFFDLNPPPERKTLAESGLRPMSYTEEELEVMGINVEELRQMRPCNAIYYRFHSAIPTTGVEDPAESEQLGPKAAFVLLKERGCHLATQEWVTNHYGLILWKLAGMVCLEPERERDPKTRRWCWPEVIGQLLYRYERELNGGCRPALRLISTEDAPAACPMILSVSNIVVRGSPMRGTRGISLETQPELEVTDGWYRLRANIDLPLARAVRRGRICIGTKLAVSGAKLSGDRKEACEILEAYDNTCLELTGNGTNLAPWHAKLGFVKQPFIATLDKLTPDGGVVPAMDLIITKTYPIAYIEFIKNPDGKVTSIGPRDEKEELKAYDQWLAKRQAESARILEELNSNIQNLQRYSERLYSRAAPRFDQCLREDDTMPDHIEGLYTEMLEEWNRPSQAWDRIDFMTAGWLHIYCKQQADLAIARRDDDLARELEEVCPPRNVRDFRVVVAKDARWRKNEPMRVVQITLWDPLKMVFSESGNPGEIKEGQRFLVTNLTPNQPGAWMTPGPGAVVYLLSKRTSRWTNIKSAKS